MLSICRKAGRLVVGFDVVKESIAGGKARLVVLASDVSEKTSEQITFAANRDRVRLLPLRETMDELSVILGRRAGVLSITDKGLAQSIVKAAENREE